MTRDELIVKQQLEIETLKISLADHKEAIDDALMQLNHPEQWSMKCPDFPRVAMSGICRARDILRDF